MRVTGTAVIGVLLAVLLGACGATAAHSNRDVSAVRTTLPTVPAAVSVRVRSAGPGTRLAPGFIGLGLEANTLARNEFPGTNLGDFMRRLDPHGLLRIGGNSVESFWTTTGEPSPAWSHGRITPRSLRGLARAIHGTGWRVILGVAFKHNTPARAASEARSAEAILGRQLDAIEIGNEPDLYRISESRYLPRFKRFAAAIKAAVPEIALAGPATSRVGTAWLPPFVNAERARPDISLLTAHEYPLTRCEGPTPTIPELLSASSEQHEITAADDAVRAGRALGVPALIDETNSVVCWGQPGVSNTYASALWILDYGLLLAEHGIVAANFQTRIAGCKPYLPVCTLPHSTQLYARPEFYGLLALRQVGTGRFLDVSNPAPAGLRTFAVRTGSDTMSVVLDDLGGATTVQLHLPAGSTFAAETTLITSSPRGLSATGGVSLGGQTVGPDAHLSAPRYRSVPVRANALTVHLQAHSATVLRLG